jgi:hypothetical protein
MSLSTNYGNDCVMTPDYLASAIVQHFRPHIKDIDLVLEPCCGEGAFVRAFEENKLSNITAFDIVDGTDFFAWNGEVEWIITNPPWSKMRAFLRHSYEVAHEVVFLALLNHLISLKARLGDAKKAGFGVREILLLDTPKQSTGWPQCGFQLAAVWFSQGYSGRPR